MIFITTTSKKSMVIRPELLFTDTDSLTYEIEAEDVYQGLLEQQRSIR